MNIYQFHHDPESLVGYDIATESIPSVAWERYKSDEIELKKREWLWAQDTKTAYEYAFYVIKDRFEEGEEAIAQDPFYAYIYAMDVLKGRFKAGEKVIAQDPYYSKAYNKFIKSLWSSGF